MSIRVIVNGAKGRMGEETLKAVAEEPGLSLVMGLHRGDNLAKTIQETQADVVVDFTTPQVVYENAKAIIAAGARPVIGTTGLTPDQIDALKSQAEQQQLGGVIAPNFSIGAILMMRFAAMAAKHFPAVEILELHHDKKIDAPSGTAIKTAQLITESVEQQPTNPEGKEVMQGARGADYHNIPIHSVRLPGLVAHQAVMFGNTGETFTLRSDAMHRSAFMPGVCLACREVMNLNGLVYGLENLV